MEPVTLQLFQASDQAAVKRLILAGLVEHWGFLDETKNPDLDDIAASYAGAAFLVGRQGERIVGCGALVPRTSTTAEIVRMSVAKDLRQQGLGRQILGALLDHARAQGFQRVILETTATWSEVVSFYQRCGFHITHYQDGDVYFELEVNSSPAADTPGVG